MPAFRFHFTSIDQLFWRARKGYLLLFLLGFFHFSLLFGETKEFYLDELVTIGLENHPSTRQAWWNAKRSAAIVGQSKASYYPSIDFQLFGTHGRDFKFINGPTTDYSIVGGDFFLSVLLADYGERKASLEATKANLIAAKWEVDATIQSVMIKILNSGYALLHAKESAESMTLSFKDSEKILHAAKELAEAGLVPITDVYTAETTFLNAKMELSDSLSKLKIQQAVLLASAGIDPSTDMKLIGSIPVFEKEDLPIKLLLGKAEEKRREIKVQQAKIAESLSLQKKAYSLYGPKLRLSGKVGEESDFRKDMHGFHYSATLNLEVPLFNGFETTYQNRAALADIESSYERLYEIRLQIASEVLSNIYALEAAEEMAVDAEKSLYYSKMAYEGVLEKYIKGISKMDDLSIAFRQLCRSRIKLSETKTRQLTALANLAYSIGTLPAKGDTACKS